MREEKLKEKSITSLKGIFWKIKSEYMRRKVSKCFICGSEHGYKELVLGHFFHSKRFDLMYNRYNCQPCCVRCNHPDRMGGNLAEYAWKLGQEFGYHVVDEIHEIKQQKERPNNTLRDNIIAGIVEYRALLKEIKKVA